MILIRMEKKKKKKKKKKKMKLPKNYKKKRKMNKLVLILTLPTTKVKFPLNTYKKQPINLISTNQKSTITLISSKNIGSTIGFYPTQPIKLNSSRRKAGKFNANFHYSSC